MSDEIQIYAAESYLHSKRQQLSPTVVYDYKRTYNYIFRHFLEPLNEYFAKNPEPRKASRPSHSRRCLFARDYGLAAGDFSKRLISTFVPEKTEESVVKAFPVVTPY